MSVPHGVGSMGSRTLHSRILWKTNLDAERDGTGGMVAYARAWGIQRITMGACGWRRSRSA